MRKIIKKIVWISLIIMIFWTNVNMSYANGDDWKKYSVEEYGDILTGEANRAAEMDEALSKAIIENKEDAQLYIDCVNAFENSEVVRAGIWNISSTVTEKKAEARETVEGTRDPENPEDNLSWISYENKIADASTDEEWREIYEAFANPVPGTGKGEMTNYIAEKYIRLVGQILDSASFQNWARVNEPNAQRTLELRMQELLENDYDIQDEEAQDIIERYGSDVDANGNPIDTNSPIYEYPQKTSDNNNSEESLEDLIEDGESFLSKGSVNIDQTALQNFSKTMYNILLAIGVVVAVIIGALIGLKLMTASVEEKAEAKKLIIPYIVGCFIVFGGFGVWKIVITILQGI